MARVAVVGWEVHLTSPSASNSSRSFSGATILEIDSLASDNARPPKREEFTAYQDSISSSVTSMSEGRCRTASTQD